MIKEPEHKQVTRSKNKNEEEVFRDNDKKIFEKSLREPWVEYVLRFSRTGKHLDQVRFSEYSHLIRKTCKHVIINERYNDGCTLEYNAHCTFERYNKFVSRNVTCPDFEIFEENPFFKRHDNDFYIRVPNKKEFKRMKNAFVKNDFVSFLLKLFRVKGLTYQQVALLFNMNYGRCRSMIAREFKRCCLEKEECMYKEHLYKKGENENDN